MISLKKAVEDSVIADLNKDNVLRGLNIRAHDYPKSKAGDDAPLAEEQKSTLTVTADDQGEFHFGTGIHKIRVTVEIRANGAADQFSGTLLDDLDSRVNLRLQVSSPTLDANGNQIGRENAFSNSGLKVFGIQADPGTRTNQQLERIRTIGRVFVACQPTSGTQNAGFDFNAIVPTGVYIRPAQAWIDVSVAFAAGRVSGNWPSLSNMGIESLTNDFVDDWFRFTHWGSPDFDLSDNAISARSNIDSILARIASNYIGNAEGTIDLTGADMAAPTLPIFTIDFNPLTVTVGDAYYGEIKRIGDGTMVLFNSAATLASGTHILWNISDDTDSFITVGISDHPTKQQIINKLVAIGSGRITDLGGLKISVAPINHDLEPIKFVVPIGEQNAGFTYLGDMTGSSAITQGNNNIGSLIFAGFNVAAN